MAATPPEAQKRKLDFNVDRNIYDAYMKACSNKGFAPQVVLEKLMTKFNQTRQI
jgi:hypothetical protein